MQQKIQAEEDKKAKEAEEQKKQEEEEKWYSKSWMCGFTDALEALNLKP